MTAGSVMRIPLGVGGTQILPTLVLHSQAVGIQKLAPEPPGETFNRVFLLENCSVKSGNIV